MKITNEQYQKIAKYLPVQRGNLKISNLKLINAVLYVAGVLQGVFEVKVKSIYLDSITVKLHPDACGA